MNTPLKQIKLLSLLNEPILIDANIFMVHKGSNFGYTKVTFDDMKDLYIIPLLYCFKKIMIHKIVYDELDLESKSFINTYIENGKITMVEEDNLYDDPQYNTIFNNIAEDELVQYNRRESANSGEVYSLAYAAYKHINYFSSRDAMVDNVASTNSELRDIQIITFDIILLVAYIYHSMKNNKNYNKALKSLYKSQCEDVIKRRKLPSTFKEYMDKMKDYIE